MGVLIFLVDMIKYYLPLFIFLALAGCTDKIPQNLQIMEAIPQNTSIVIQVNDTLALSSSELLLKIFELEPGLKKTIKNITPQRTPLPFAYCITPIGKDQNAVGFITKTTPADSLITYQTELKYSGQTIGTIDKGGQTFYISKLGNLKMIAESQLMVENGIRNFQRKNRGITSPEFFQLAESIDQDLTINFFIHPSSKSLFNSVFPSTPLFPKTGKQWLALDLEVEGDYFSLDGVAFLNDSIPDALNLIKSLKPRETHLHNIVPKNFTSYLSITVDNVRQFEDNFKDYSRSANIPLNKIDFSPLNSVSEIGWVNAGTEQSVIFHLNSLEDIPDFTLGNAEPKTYRGASYSKIELPKELISLLSSFGQKVSPAWSCLYEDYLILSETESGLKNLLTNYIDQNTLGKNPTFKALKERLANENSFLWIGQTKNLIDYWENNGNTTKGLSTLPVSDYPLVVFQGVGEEDFSHLHLSVQKDQPFQNKGGVNNSFSIALPKAATIPPQWLKNHRNNGMDIAVQDQENILYLFSNTGKLYWKKQLDAKIISPIQQVDLYKNKRLQMAFRTQNRLMVLDRNGNIVKPFNIKLPKSNQPLPLAIFDYDNNRNYRFLVTQDRSIYMYNGDGKRVNGFKLKKVDAPILSAPKHLRFQGKDYIVMPLENNRLKIVSRTGLDRIKVKGDIKFSDNEIFSYLNTFATTNREGSLIQIDTRGNKVTSSLGLSPNHKIDATTKSLVTLSENNLNIKGIPVILPFGNYTSPKIFYLNNTLYISTTDQEAQKVYLFYSNGKAVEGFPVYGNSAIDLSNSDKDKALEMVVTAEDNSILVYEINR